MKPLLLQKEYIDKTVKEKGTTEIREIRPKNREKKLCSSLLSAVLTASCRFNLLFACCWKLQVENFSRNSA